jgi:signal transduction histidine kinase
MTGNPTIWNRVWAPVVPRKPGRVGLIAVYLVFLAVFARTFTAEIAASLLVSYLGLEIGYLLLFSLALWKPGFPQWIVHFYFIVQCTVVLWLLTLWPDFDFVTVLFFLLSYQAALFFRGRVCWTWILIIILLTAESLVFYYGFSRGLGLALTIMAAEIVIPAYVIVNQETEAAKIRSLALLGELDETNRQLKQYTSQVENMTAIQERNHLARTLHDSVSQMMFSIALTSRAAQSLLEKDPAHARLEITHLQTMTAEALSQLRTLITDMRPPSK